MESKVKITDNIVEEAIGYTIIASEYNSGFISITPVIEAVKELAGKYFWLPALELLNEAEIITFDLVPGKIMLLNGMALAWSTLAGDDNGNPKYKESYCITYHGKQFLNTLLNSLVQSYDDLNHPSYSGQK